MKKISCLLFVAVMLITACQQKKETVAIDTTAEKDSISKNLDAMYAAYTKKDAKTFASFLTEDCLYCGTDSKEFWDKKGYKELLNKISADTSYRAPTFTLNKREIRLDKSGNSAVVVDQLLVSGWTDNLPLRNVTHHIKTNNRWMCDFSSMSIVPNNEDLEKLFHAVAEQ
jgi:ketosteroid isomerase-like protein